MSALHLTKSFHQPPSEYTMALPLPTSLSQHTHTHTHSSWCCQLSHWLIGLCHAVTVTFDIFMQLSKMSANYPHTMPHIHSFTSIFHPHCHNSISFCCQAHSLKHLFGDNIYHFDHIFFLLLKAVIINRLQVKRGQQRTQLVNPMAATMTLQ